MAARRCSRCSTNWPDGDEYKECPACEITTWLSRSSVPLDDAKARSLRLHHEFERYYEAREREQAAALERLVADDTTIFND